MFEFDDDLTYAHLKVRRRGIVHEVTWRATTQPQTVASEIGCGSLPAGAAVGLERSASAGGTVLGRRVTGSAGIDGDAVDGRIHLLRSVPTHPVWKIRRT